MKKILLFISIIVGLIVLIGFATSVDILYFWTTNIFNFKVTTPQPKLLPEPIPDDVKSKLTGIFTETHKFGPLTFSRHSHKKSVIVTLTKVDRPREPEIYHDALFWCTETWNADIKNLYIHFQDWEFDCNEAMTDYEQSGSKSDGLYVLSFKNQKELDAVTAAFDPYYKELDPDKTLTLLKKALAEHESATIYHHIGLITYRKQTEFKSGTDADVFSAEQYYRLGVAKDPYYAPLLSSLALTIVERTGKFTPESEDLFRDAKKVDPHWSYSWANRALLFIRLGRYQEGYEEAKLAVMANPKFNQQPNIVQIFVCAGKEANRQEKPEFYKEYNIDKEELMKNCY